MLYQVLKFCFKWTKIGFPRSRAYIGVKEGINFLCGDVDCSTLAQGSF